MNFNEGEYFNTEEPGLEGENTGNNQETLDYELQNVDEEKIEQALKSIEGVLYNEEKLNRANKLWEERYKEDPSFFWEQESIKFLKTISAGERVQLLKRAARFLQMSPSDTFLYSQNFLEDISAFGLFLDENGGPSTSFEFKLAGLVASNLEQTYSFIKNSRWIRQSKEVEERRNLTKEHTLMPDEFYLGDNLRVDYEILENEYFKVFISACERSSFADTRVNTENMFGDEFKRLSLVNKIDFLKRSIAHLHNILLEDEVFNSAFTKDSQTRLQLQQNYRGYNSAHSMLFKTRQPSRVYEMAQENFDYEMNNTASRGGYVEEYPFHRMLLASVKKLSEIISQADDSEKKENKEEIQSVAQIIVDLWDKNRNPIFANVIAETLTTLDATYSSQLLLDKVKHEKEDKTALSAILYRLEFGQIGISKEGVKYLERMYDLGEFNKPDYFVNRLTARGEMGIFNEQSELLRYFYLENFDDEDREKVIQPAVLEFAYETLFVPKENETSEEQEQRLQFLEEFKQSYFEFYDEKFLERTGVRFNNLTFKEQGAFLLFIKAVDEVTKEKVFDFANVHREKGIRLFLLINQKDFFLGQKILNLSSTLDEKSIDVVIDALSGVLSRLEDVSEFTEKDPILQKAVQTQLPEIQRKIIEKAFTTLEQVIDTTSQDDTESIPDRILKKLKNINADAIMLASTLTSVRHMDISNMDRPLDILNNFSDTGLYDYEGYEFSNQELQQIKEMYEKNYAQTPELLTVLYGGFLESLKKHNVEYKVIKQKDKVVALFAFEYLEDGSIYAGKFNIQQSYQGAELGSEMMENTLDRYAQTHIINAECNIEAAVSSNYIERGFVAVMGYDFQETKSLQIVRNESMRNFLISKEWSDFYISEQAKMGEQVLLGEGEIIVYSCPIEEIRSSPLEILDKVEEDGSRYVLSRFLREKKGKKPGDKLTAYFVFEKLDKENYEEYQTSFKRNFIDNDSIFIV